MRISEQEYYQYLSIHPKLIHYAGIKKKCISKNITLEEFMNSSAQEKFPSREALYDNIHLIDQYVNEYSDILSNEELSILKEFKNFRRGKFYVTKFTKKHALFMDEEFVFGVLALGDPFDSFWHKTELPALVETVLLPYKGRIIYDGIFLSSPIRFGKGISSSLKSEFEKKKSQYGTILQLPIDEEVKGKKINHEELLITMMKTKASREHNWYEIDELLDSNPQLLPCYNKEWGRINSRNKKKELKELGIKNYHFAIYRDTIISSGKSQIEVKSSIPKIVKDKNLLQSIFYFKV